ncbi:hypothetical protein JOQ06_004318 [Pogonophryne albipinna]|uniref:Uncharacterized protein n=1 Tax=Pogonophryne albipinna TaxID=1090488 RepID=A0AAD6FCI6_9TELE|nr:hypothetical protein JOQ06_004318 [Pogonophryne albipinna]
MLTFNKAKRRKTDNTVEPAVFKVPEMQEPEEDMVVDSAPADSIPAEGPVDAPPSLSSFAPTDFIFKASTGLSSFKFDPLTPCSADAFLTPRSEMSKETGALSALCVVWEPKVEDESIPEEMRDSIRTIVGQVGLLMKERFKQFGGLVDDCDLSRGEKITTCTNLQGFWDMKFEALKVAESRSWMEEHKPAPRQRKVVKKPSAAPAKPAAGAKSRLAAVKVAMKAKQQAAGGGESSKGCWER